MTDERAVIWNRAAEEYADIFDGQVTEAIEPTLDAAAVATGCTLLDIATGPGIIAAAASARGADVVGVDLAENMINVARLRHPAIRFEVADATDLPFEDESFDAVTMGFALFMIPEPDKALREAHRVLRAGGKFAASLWDWPVPGMSLFYDEFAKYVDEEMLPVTAPLMGVSDHDTLMAALSYAGFADPTVNELPIVWELSDAGHLFNAMASLRDLSSLSVSQLESFRAAVTAGVEALENRVPFPALIVSGVK
jgi:ubiquinone/menaquinone biosynthesis C-methylase UbiE